ncbi:MAG: hypothetical protein MUF54_24975, partial [Polyangiaceae bacterium]|nr:hypothetical protein [Polyangiaceae bacterium]
MRCLRAYLPAGAAVVLAAAAAGAQPVPSSSPALPPDLTAPAGAAQRALTVGLRPDTGSTLRLYARACAATPCPLEPLPSEPLLRLPDLGQTVRARLTVVAIGAGRHLVHVDAGTGASRWQALVAGPLQAEQAPRVLWHGATPDPPPAGAESVAAVHLMPASKGGTVRVLVGERRADLALCGRPSLLTPRVVYEQDLQLRHVKLQRLDGAERARAQQLTATRTEPDAPRPLASLLVATGASSGHGSPGALTDGAPQTVWSEARGGEGRGEFVVMRAPSEVPIEELSFLVRPPQGDIEHGAAPRTFFVAADGRLLQVTLPQDAWNHPGARYVVRPVPPLRTSCLAVVLDEAFVRDGDKHARVTLSEVTAYSAFDGVLDHAGLAAELDAGGERAPAAAAVLLRGGQAASIAIATQYPKLGQSGRTLALQVLDAAPCEVSSPVFAARLASEAQGEQRHARDRVRRCGRRAVDALVA